MKASSRKMVNLLRGGDLGFIAVVIAAYFSALAVLAYNPRPFPLIRLVVLIAASVLFLIIGTYGFALCKRAHLPSAALVYFAIQILLAGTVVYLVVGGVIWLILVPLAAQSAVLLPRRWMLTVCTIIIAAQVVPDVLRFGPMVAAVRGIILLAAIVFVVVFTQIAASERRARAEVERLADELSEANRKLREYAAQIEELATTKERNRLAREIHDSLGHYLTVINVQIEAARAVIASDRERALDALRKAQSLTQEGLGEVRRSVAALHASPIESRTLREAVAELVNECSAAGLDARLSVEGVSRALAPQAELTLYRAAQEGLTNVRKHSRASHANVTLDYSKDTMVRLAVEDDGIGWDAGEAGFGLLGLRERAQLLGGEVRVHSAAGKGFKLEVELPA